MKPALVSAEIINIILRHVSDVTGRKVDSPTLASRLGWASLGLDSILVFQLQMKLEQEFDMILEDTFLLDCKTPEAAAQVLMSRKVEERHP